jgi:DNA-binding transcriptional ArsR family regulator
LPGRPVVALIVVAIAVSYFAIQPGPFRLPCWFSRSCTVSSVAVAAVDLDVLARIGKALSDATRRSLLVTLLDGPQYPAELTERLGLTKANVSNHLACLRGCGLVRATPEGRRVRYELVDRRLADALTGLANLNLPVEDPTCGPESCP